LSIVVCRSAGLTHVHCCDAPVLISQCWIGQHSMSDLLSSRELDRIKAADDPLSAVLQIIGLARDTWDAFDQALGSVPSFRVFALTELSAIKAAISSCRISCRSGDVAGERVLTPEERTHLGLAWRMARQCMDLPDIEVQVEVDESQHRPPARVGQANVSVKLAEIEPKAPVHPGKAAAESSNASIAHGRQKNCSTFMSIVEASAKNLSSMTTEEIAEYVCKHFPEGEGRDALRRQIIAQRYDGARLTFEVACNQNVENMGFYINVFRFVEAYHGEKVWAFPSAAQSSLATLKTIYVKLKLDSTRISFPGASDDMLNLLYGDDGGSTEDGLFRMLNQLQITRNRVYDHFFPPSRQLGDRNFWVVDKGGEPYVSPEGWLRLSFTPNLSDEELRKVLDSWAIAYHGTAGKNIASIARLGLLKPGKTGIKNNHGHAGVSSEDDCPIYVSASIEYAAHYVFTTTSHEVVPGRMEAQAPDVEFADEGYAQFVFEVRVDPTRVRRRLGNTMIDALWPKGLPFDEYFDWEEREGNLEWLIDDPSAIHVTGLMCRVLPHKMTPAEFNASRIRKMQEIVRDNREGRGRWEWNSGASTLDSAGPFTPYADEISAKIEDAYQKYASIAFYTIPGQGSYYIDFRSMTQHRANGDGEQVWRMRKVRRLT